MTSSIPTNVDTVEAVSRTASIIPFPARPKPAAPSPEERLAKALQSLDAALAHQRTAVAEWRDVLSKLKVAAGSLDEGLQRYRTNLRTLSTSVSSLNAKARSLEQWADGVTGEHK